MPAFTDWRCPECRRRFGVATEHDDDYVTCPHCGHELDIREAMAQIAKAREAFLNKENEDDLES